MSDEEKRRDLVVKMNKLLEWAGIPAETEAQSKVASSSKYRK